MADVREVRLLGRGFLQHGHGLGQREVRDVLLAAQGVEHDDVGIAELGAGFGANVVGIGEVAEAADAEAQHGQLVVQGPQGLHGHAQHLKGRVVALDGVQHHAGHAGILVLGKNVGKLLLQLAQHARLGKNGHVRFLPEVEGPNVVQPGGVVLVLVGEKQGVEVRDAGAQHLLPEIGARINYEAAPAHRQVNGHPQAVVAVVERAAHLAGAANHGHARRGARAEESNGHSVKSYEVRVMSWGG